MMSLTLRLGPTDPQSRDLRSAADRFWTVLGAFMSKFGQIFAKIGSEFGQIAPKSGQRRSLFPKVSSRIEIARFR